MQLFKTKIGHDLLPTRFLGMASKKKENGSVVVLATRCFAYFCEVIKNPEKGDWKKPTQLRYISFNELVDMHPNNQLIFVALKQGDEARAHCFSSKVSFEKNEVFSKLLEENHENCSYNGEVARRDKSKGILTVTPITDGVFDFAFSAPGSDQATCSLRVDNALDYEDNLNFALQSNNWYVESDRFCLS